MKFTILTIGKLKERYLRDGVDEFVKRITPYGAISITELPEAKIGNNPSDAQRQEAVKNEGERLLKQINDKSYFVLLDVYGKTISSEKLAEKVRNLEVSGTSEMTFVIGGAFGVSQELREKADFKLSFSPMTFTHQMVRLLLVEQLYRSCKINRNEPYHW